MVTEMSGETLTLNVGDAAVSTYYHDLGPKDGPPLILMQTGGAGTTAFMCWYKNMGAFANTGYRVLAPDAPGFGRSTSSGRVDAVAFLVAFMDALGIESAHLVGNSMGSMTSARFASEYPARALSLVLSGGEPRAETPEAQSLAPSLGRTPRMDFVREMLTKPALTSEDMRRATADFFFDRDHPAVGETTMLRLAALSDEDLLNRSREDALGQLTRGRSNYDASLLGRIQAPTFLLHGRDEVWFYPAEAVEPLVSAAVKASFEIPDCRCTLLPRCAHWPQLEQADTYNSLVLQFLADTRAQTG